jgi:integrase
MRGSVYKRCAEKGCRSSPRCNHPWWMTFSQEGRRVRTSADAFAKMPVPNKTDVEKGWLPRFVMAIVEGRYPEAQPGSATIPATTDVTALTVTDFLRDYRRRHCEAEKLNMDSLGWKLQVIERRFGTLPITALQKPGPIEDFKTDLIEGDKAHSTINRYLAQLKHMINWAIGRELVSRSPFFHKTRNPTGIKLLKGENKRRRRLDSNEEQALLDACDEMKSAAPDHVGGVLKGRLYAALDLGLRRGEMLKARNRDVDWKAQPGPVFTIQWGNAKLRKERQDPLTSVRVARFLKSRRLVGGPDGYPFGSPTGEYVQNFRKSWETLLTLAGITDPERGLDGDLHWHDLRHECGSRYADRGMDGRHIQMLLGHSDLKTTERYLNSDTRRLAEAMKRATGGRA